MMKVKQRLGVVAALILALTLVFGGFAHIAARAEDAGGGTISPIIDECDSTVNTEAKEYYSVAIQTSEEGKPDNPNADLGFGAVSRFISTKSPTAAPTLANMWEADYGYLNYKVSGHNLIKVTVDTAPEAVGAFDPIFVYAHNGGGVLEVNNTVKTPSSNWTRIEYTYIIAEGAEYVRVIPSAYVEGDAKAMWMQQITKVEITRVEELPPKDEVTVAPVYTDICNGNAIEGQRAKDGVYNVAVNNDRQDKIGDPDRIIFGANPGADQSYIDYNLKSQDTVIVTAYEEILENNARPESATIVKFSLFGKNWEVDATEVKVELGDYATGGWNKLNSIFKLDNVSDGKVRVHIYKPADGQSEIELGHVDIYDSNTANVAKLNAKHDLERYSYLKGQSNYSSVKWAELRNICDEALAAIDGAEDSEVEAIVTEAKADMNAVLTAVAEFEANKAVWKKEITDFANEKGESNYTAENWAKIQGFVTEAHEKIDAATSDNAATNAILDAKEKINEVEKKQEGGNGDDGNPDDNNPNGGDQQKPEETKKKKCGGELSASGFALSLGALMLAIAVCALVARKKASKE